MYSWDCLHSLIRSPKLNCGEVKADFRSHDRQLEGVRYRGGWNPRVMILMVSQSIESAGSAVALRIV